MKYTFTTSLVKKTGDIRTIMLTKTWDRIEQMQA